MIVYSEVGQNVNIECPLTPEGSKNDPKEIPKWYRQSPEGRYDPISHDGEIINGTCPKCTITTEAAKWKLTIRDIQPEYVGNYSCTLSDGSDKEATITLRK